MKINGQFHRNILRRLVPGFYLKAVRDTDREFKPNSKFEAICSRPKWDIKRRKELEGELSAVNKQIIDVHTSFDAVKNHLEKMAEMIPPYNQDTATIQAIPDRMFGILSRAQIMLTSATGAGIPLRRHGEGSHIHRLKYDSQELLLCMDGYGEFYKKNVPSDSFSTTSDHTTLDY